MVQGQKVQLRKKYVEVKVCICNQTPIYSMQFYTFFLVHHYFTPPPVYTPYVLVYLYPGDNILSYNMLKSPKTDESHSPDTSHSSESTQYASPAPHTSPPRSRRYNPPDGSYSTDAQSPQSSSVPPTSPTPPGCASPTPRPAHSSTHPGAASAAYAPAPAQSIVAGAGLPRTACRRGCTACRSPAAGR